MDVLQLLRQDWCGTTEKGPTRFVGGVMFQNRCISFCPGLTIPELVYQGCPNLMGLLNSPPGAQYGGQQFYQ